MKPIAEVYPDLKHEDGWFSTPCKYQPMLDSLGYAIALQVDDNDYQGDSRLLLRDGVRVGWLQFGWGSCSGCDALQACDSYDCIDALRTQLHDSIKWFDTNADALAFFRSHDWQGDYAWSNDEQKTFVDGALKLLDIQVSA